MNHTKTPAPPSRTTLLAKVRTSDSHSMLSTWYRTNGKQKALVRKDAVRRSLKAARRPVDSSDPKRTGIGGTRKKKRLKSGHHFVYTAQAVNRSPSHSSKRKTDSE